VWSGNPRVVGSELLLVIVVVAALSFDFTNGFRDTANAMATSIATRAHSASKVDERGGGDHAATGTAVRESDRR
jgi:hypothetical protein